MRRLKSMCSTIICAVVLLSVTTGSAAGSQPNIEATNTVNAVLGDASWIAVHNQAPGVQAGEVERIRTHLLYVIDRLDAVETSELSTSQQKRRARALDGLREYASAGIFPQRDVGDGFGPRRPRFIDDRGVHCAVGELIRRSGRPELARAIGEQFEYSYIPDVDSPALLSWASRHGLELDELAMIQPSYSSPPTAPSVRRVIKAAKDGVTLTCARKHEPPEAIELQVRGDDQGKVTIEHKGNANAFATCFRKEMSKKSQAGGAWDTEPTPFRFSVKLDITPAKKLFERRLEHTRFNGATSGCLPRPGAIPKTAKLRIRSNLKGTRVEVHTEPTNEEVQRCLTEYLRKRFPELEGGGRWEIDLRATKTVEPAMTGERLRNPFPHAAMDCADKEGAPQNLSVKVKANPKTQRFELETESGDAEYQACLEEKYNERAQSTFSVPRKMPSGKYERYFRIDAAAEATLEASVSEADPSVCPDGGTTVSMGQGTMGRCEGRMVKPER